MRPLLRKKLRFVRGEIYLYRLASQGFRINPSRISLNYCAFSGAYVAANSRSNAAVQHPVGRGGGGNRTRVLIREMQASTGLAAYCFVGKESLRKRKLRSLAEPNSAWLDSARPFRIPVFLTRLLPETAVRPALIATRKTFLRAAERFHAIMQLRRNRNCRYWQLKFCSIRR